MELLQNADDAMGDSQYSLGEIGSKGIGFKSILEISEEPENSVQTNFGVCVFFGNREFHGENSCRLCFQFFVEKNFLRGPAIFKIVTVLLLMLREVIFSWWGFQFFDGKD